MKFSSLVASAILALSASAAFAAPMSGVDPASPAIGPKAASEELVTRENDNGQIEIQQADGSFTALQVSESENGIVQVSDGKDVGLLAPKADDTASADTQCSGQGCIEQVWWGGGWHHHWHHHWGHFAWHHHFWFPHRHFWRGGWHYHHWHHGWHHGW